YLRRSGETGEAGRQILRRMLLAALISGVPLLATWGAVQWASAWAHKLGQDAVKAGLHSESVVRHWKEYTQLASAVGAIVGTVGSWPAGAAGGSPTSSCASPRWSRCVTSTSATRRSTQSS